MMQKQKTCTNTEESKRHNNAYQAQIGVFMSERKNGFKILVFCTKILKICLNPALKK